MSVDPKCPRCQVTSYSEARPFFSF